MHSHRGASAYKLVIPTEIFRLTSVDDIMLHHILASLRSFILIDPDWLVPMPFWNKSKLNLRIREIGDASIVDL